MKNVLLSLVFLTVCAIGRADTPVPQSEARDYYCDISLDPGRTGVGEGAPLAEGVFNPAKATSLDLHSGDVSLHVERKLAEDYVLKLVVDKVEAWTFFNPPYFIKVSPYETGGIGVVSLHFDKNDYVAGCSYRHAGSFGKPLVPKPN